MTEVVIVDGGDDTPAEEAAEAVAEVQAEATGDVADAAVQIAEIEANKEITLAVIAAETEEARDEAWRDSRITELSAENERLWTENNSLTARVSELETELSTLLNSVALEQPPNPTPPESGVADPTQVSQTLTEAVPPPEPAKKRRPVRFI